MEGNRWISDDEWLLSGDIYEVPREIQNVIDSEQKKKDRRSREERWKKKAQRKKMMKNTTNGVLALVGAGLIYNLLRK